MFVVIYAHLDPAPELNANEKRNSIPAHKKSEVQNEK
jgi:hypothetical protein